MPAASSSRLLQFRNPRFHDLPYERPQGAVSPPRIESSLLKFRNHGGLRVRANHRGAHRKKAAVVRRGSEADQRPTVEPEGGHPVAEPLLGAWRGRVNRFPKLLQRRTLCWRQGCKVLVDARWPGARDGALQDILRCGRSSVLVQTLFGIRGRLRKEPRETVEIDGRQERGIDQAVAQDSRPEIPSAGEI